MYEHELIAEVPEDFFQGADWVETVSNYCSLLGINQVPDPFEDELLIGALRNEYKNHSLAEVKIALRMCVLDEYPEPIEAYNRLNLRFLAKVMKAYRNYRKDIVKRYEDTRLKLERPAPVVPTQFEMDMQVATEIWDDYLRVCHDILIFPVSYKAELLLKLGVVSAEVLTSVESEVRAALLAQNPETKRKDDRGRVEQLQKNKELQDIYVSNDAKCKIYLKWLNELCKAEVDFNGFCELVESRVFIFHGETKIHNTLPPV